MSGREGFTSTWTRRVAPDPLSVSPMIQRAVSPAAIGRAGQALARLQCDVGDLAGCGIDLIERAFRPGIDLYSVVVALATWLDARRGIGALDALDRRACCCAAFRRRPGRRDVQRLWPVVGDGGRHGRKRRHVGIVGDLRRLLRGGAAGKRNAGKQQHRNGGFTETRKDGDPEKRLSGSADDRPVHWLISRDQLMALT
jgi:hypothetical protein